LIQGLATEKKPLFPAGARITNQKGGEELLLVRDVFVTKPGMASKLAKLMHETWQPAGARVMTDLTGEFNQVVMESEVKDLAELEARLKDYASNQKIREKMRGYTEMYQTGRREVFQIQG
jgi:hypothetical protein